QTSSMLENYFTYPVNVDVKVISNASLPMPAVTICPHTIINVDENPSLVRAVFEERTGENFTDLETAKAKLSNLLDIKTYWDLLTWNMSNMIDECYLGRNKTCLKQGKFREVYTMNGPCLSYFGEPTRLAGAYHGIYLKLKNPEYKPGMKLGKEIPRGWTVVVHDPVEDPSLIVKTHGYFVSYNWNKDISVSLKEFHSLDSSRKHCQTEPGVSSSRCLNECFSTVFAKQMRCRLPFMYPKIEVAYCKGQRNLARAERLLDSMLLRGEWMPLECKCTQPCHRFIYEYKGDTTDNRDDDMGKVERLVIERLCVSVHPSVRLYVNAALMEELSGILGIIQLLTAVEVIEFIIAATIRLFNSRINKGNDSSYLNRTNDISIHREFTESSEKFFDK
ncbi:unnamed protein product, partial [Meganyctiphanes norvegica]